MNKGNYSDDRLPKFFKVYLPGESGDDLGIPVSFNSCLPNSKPRNVTVRSIYGNVWKLELRKRCGVIEKFAMVDGWKRIVKDEDLKGGEFLAFEFDGYRLFNFCIYGQATCKRLGNSVKTKEMEAESDGEDGEDDNSSDDDDDEDDYEDDEFEAADVDADADDVEADGGDGDADDEAFDVDDDDVEADGDADDDDVEADGDADDEQRQYLDDRDNPSFTVTITKNKSQLLIPTRVIKDYNLSFPEAITVADPLATKFGTLERKITVHDNGGVYIRGFASVFRRNNVKTTDKMICEVKKSGNGLVHTVKVYIVKG